MIRLAKAQNTAVGTGGPAMADALYRAHGGTPSGEARRSLRCGVACA
ncbi:hypothetical protein DFJ69_2120 [Thermomonospora umbrina]|uniref:Uncharacterized protein n=1 Tax=Thermomonospora umbrina TaxID=111806 RepID=A0A3D9SL67_9ACTN|nr:hypothetical protein DFJ69_2120 [Thermomonospora umbrina]